MIKFIFMWILFWIIPWIGVYSLFKKYLNYQKIMLFTSIYFAIFSIISYFYYQPYLSYIGNQLRTIIIFSFFIILGILLVYSICNKKFKKPAKKIIKKYPFDQYLSLDKRYILPKSFEIFYQQTLISAFINFLKINDFNWIQIGFYFSILFGLAHIMAIKIHKNLFGIILFISAIISAFLFSFIYNNYEWGFIYSYLVHWLFYLILGISFWIYNK